ncbi:serine/threonine-protein kinase [Pararhodonellum marinum]|uniref:serine/threonine-protein kinase n=1 Tax=Pararhodonellum marinum TaxID=2755358 RepID=UPI00188F87B6|nr:serine/threonine-protein kinase [Pararhodonellum marinum]
MKNLSSSWALVETYFHQLVEMAGESKRKTLEKIKSENPELHSLLVRLLAADQNTHPIFTNSAEILFDQFSSDEDLIGDKVGPFELSGLIGQGAMGSVFLGNRADGQFDQKVAIKIMRAFVLDNTNQALFQKERQILANLSHPNIAKLYDGGFTDDGRPFFTMEYISGEDIITYSKSKELKTKEKLELFLQIAEAIRYAHRSFVAHLDLKPKNIIIDQDDRVKLLDFGVSKILQETEFPDESGRFTLAYAAPEQISKGVPNSSADIYSLGIILYELLGKKHPFEAYFDNPGDLKKAVMSAEYEKLELKENQLFQEDLSQICMKAMQFDPSNRYSSVDSMINDIRAFLNGYPISVRENDLAYVGKKYFKRQQKILTAIGASLVILIGMGIFYALQLKEQRNIAIKEAKKAEEITDLLSDVFMAADPSASSGDTITALELLNKGVESLEKNLGKDPELLASMLIKISPIYLSLGQYEQGKFLAEQAYQINSELFTYPHPVLAESEILKGDVYFFYGKLDSAEFYSKKGLKQLLDTKTKDEMKLANSMDGLGNIIYELGRYEEADSIIRIIHAIHQKHLTPPHTSLANDLHMLGSIKRKMQKYDEAEKYLLASLEMKKELFAEPHLELALSYNHIGSLYQNKGDAEASIPYIKKSMEQREAILGKNHVETMASVSNLARAYFHLGKFDEALPLYLSSFSTISGLFGEEHYYYASVANSLGMTYFNLGNIQEAKNYLSLSAEVNKKLFPETDKRNAISLMNLAKVLAAEENHLEAINCYKTAYKILDSAEKKDDRLISQCQQALGECSLALGNYSTAIEYLEMALLNSQSSDDVSQETISEINGSLEKAYLAINN